jgi:uncharacterized membrane protein
MLFCPDGAQIESTVERITGYAGISSVTIDKDGAWEIEHDGETEVDWDSETTATEDGQQLYCCEQGEWHKSGTLELRIMDDDGEYVAVTKELGLV